MGRPIQAGDQQGALEGRRRTPLNPVNPRQGGHTGRGIEFAATHNNTRGIVGCPRHEEIVLRNSPYGDFQDCFKRRLGRFGSRHHIVDHHCAPGCGHGFGIFRDSGLNPPMELPHFRQRATSNVKPSLTAASRTSSSRSCRSWSRRSSDRFASSKGGRSRSTTATLADACLRNRCSQAATGWLGSFVPRCGQRR